MGNFTIKILANRDLSFLYVLSGIIGSVVTYAFGGFSGMLELFFLAILFDWITGISASVKEGKGLSSQVGFLGGMRKVLMIGTVFFAHRADLAFGVDWVMMGVIYFWLANELVSISENFGRLGIPFPSSLKKLITILKDKEEDASNGKTN